MSQYEIKSGRTLFMCSANSIQEAAQKFKQSCGDLPIEGANCVGSASVLDIVAQKYHFNKEKELEKGRESFFDYWKHPNNGNY